MAIIDIQQKIKEKEEKEKLEKCAKAVGKFFESMATFPLEESKPFPWSEIFRDTNK